MKIAIASDDGKTIASHFGRCRGFVVCTIEDGSITGRDFRPNSSTHHMGLHHGEDHAVHSHGPIIAALTDCTAVITHGMGRRALDDLTRAGINVFVTEETDVDRAGGLFVEGKLVHRPDLSCGHHQHGQGGCGGH
ncbi:MAG: NifB/NifX family molybdenum-iron cluster-binding protein [candidate division Zixibacteria bacterium]|nr:NifB/NifX family molybdenum-iron cluster-binding protein [candidate division Zixibacteria bacterium]